VVRTSRKTRKGTRTAHHPNATTNRPSTDVRSTAWRRVDALIRARPLVALLCPCQSVCYLDSRPVWLSGFGWAQDSSGGRITRPMFRRNSLISFVPQNEKDTAVFMLAKQGEARALASSKCPESEFVLFGRSAPFASFAKRFFHREVRYSPAPTVRKRNSFCSVERRNWLRFAKWKAEASNARSQKQNSLCSVNRSHSLHLVE
jgi:hypothetical protein